jgi:hypothetical protein
MALDDWYANKFAPLDSMSIYPKSGHKLLYTPMTGEIKCLTNIRLPCVFHSISFGVDATHAPTWSQMIWSTSYHCMTVLVHRSWPHLLFTIALVHQRQVITQLSLHTCNWSIEPSLVLIFSTLVTWLNVMSHMQWAPSSHVWALQQIQAIFTVMAWVAHTSVPVD